MFYRRKVILALLESVDGSASLHHHMFLFTRGQASPVYDFVPFHEGPFAFSLEADREPMIRAGLIEPGGGWRKKTNDSYRDSLTPDDHRLLMDHSQTFGKWTHEQLRREIAVRYPYYAINTASEPANLSDAERRAVDEARPKPGSPTLFTIGYEGISLETYLNRLIEHQVSVLCDVRFTTASHKYGFSKSILRNVVEQLGIQYVHFPELGIDPAERRDVSTPEQYQELFDWFEATVLPEKKESLEAVRRLLDEHGRIALTCFEMDPLRCHRSRVAAALMHMPGRAYQLEHIQ